MNVRVLSGQEVWMPSQDKEYLSWHIFDAQPSSALKAVYMCVSRNGHFTDERVTTRIGFAVGCIKARPCDLSLPRVTDSNLGRMRASERMLQPLQRA